MSNAGASKETKGMYGFDPSGLERAAAAAKYLDNSQNSKNAFELATKKEETLQLETKKAIK
jgi:ATPase family AAA domain-containing protein 3A/B